MAAVAVAGDAHFVDTARAFLTQCDVALQEHNVDGAWHFLNGARRTMTLLRPQDQLPEMVAAIRAEAAKLSKRRRRAIDALIGDGRPITYSAVVEAQRIRDDAAETRYDRVRLLQKQLQLVMAMAVGAIASILVLVGTTATPLDASEAWSWRLLGLVLAFGILGACVSAVRSLTAAALEMNIPVLVATNTIAAVRVVLGAVPGLAAYVFLRSGLINVGTGAAGALTVAFIGGFSERLIVRIAESIAGKDDSQGDGDKPTKDGK